MDKYEEQMLAQSLSKINKSEVLPDMLKWCKDNFVYRLPASGWVIGIKEECCPIPFDELYSTFVKCQTRKMMVV